MTFRTAYKLSTPSGCFFIAKPAEKRQRGPRGILVPVGRQTIKFLTFRTTYINQSTPSGCFCFEKRGFPKTRTAEDFQNPKRNINGVPTRYLYSWGGILSISFRFNKNIKAPQVGAFLSQNLPRNVNGDPAGYLYPWGGRPSNS